MNEYLEIMQLSSVEGHIEDLTVLLADVVNDGASIGFVPPLSKEDARAYWEQVIQSDVKLFVLIYEGKVAGSVQLHLSMKQNGLHRAEIAKLMTSPAVRRKGLGRRLLYTAESNAVKEGRTLIVLDTRDGDPSNSLYTSAGYVFAGQIPYYAMSANGELHSTNYYYKRIDC
ncbi:GNAT family N-acetyltransferase [Neobacillus mesonae]|nr:GNAT family N-acetyltransferase [Neobacillus mesonae]